MRTIIYLNLFIDNDWDQNKIIDQIFPFKIDSSTAILKSYTHLGVFFGSKNDIAIVESPIDPDFHLYLQKYFGPLASPVLAENFAACDVKGAKLFLVGVSNKEMSLFGRDNLLELGWPTPEKYREINSKDFLLALAARLKFRFPRSRLMNFVDIIHDMSTPYPFCIKFLNSAGGRGVFRVDNDRKILGFLERQLEDELDNLKVVQQEFINIKNHFYTVFHTDQQSGPFGFLIDYDDKGNSKRHILDRNISTERITLARDMARELQAAGHNGAFGFDGFYDEKGQEYPAIDLNVRVDKSKVFQEILDRFDYNGKHVEFWRERFTTVTFVDFKSFYQQKVAEVEKLSLEFDRQFQLIILLCSNLFHDKAEETIGEITFMVIKKEHASEQEYKTWLDKAYRLLGIRSDEK